MAPIICTKCSWKNSDKAIICQNCVHPLCNDHSTHTTFPEEVKNDSGLIEFPDLPADLSIGKQIINWSNDAFFSGFFDPRENSISKIPGGKVSVLLFTHGIRIDSKSQNYEIHNAQIICLKTASHEDLVKYDKSVVGRAMLGGLILGPLGALVGGMSGIGSKEKFVKKYYFIINYWDIETRIAQAIIISTENNSRIESFILRQQKEQSLNHNENRQPKPNTPPVLLIISIVIVICVIAAIAANESPDTIGKSQATNAKNDRIVFAEQLRKRNGISEVNSNRCVMLSDIAESMMNSRQSGVSIERTMNTWSSDRFLFPLIYRAYDQPREQTTEGRVERTTNFARDTLEECLNDYVKK